MRRQADSTAAYETTMEGGMDHNPSSLKDDPILVEVHRRAEALAKTVLSIPPKTQRELTGGGEGKAEWSSA